MLVKRLLSPICRPEVETRLVVDKVEILLLSRSVGRNADDIAQVIFGNRAKKSVSRIEDSIALMSRRKQLLGDAYPFGSGDEALIPTDDGLTWYSSLALCSNLSRATLEVGNELLDEICSSALPGLLGPGTEVVKFAWPVRSSPNPRPEPFHEAIAWLGQRIGLNVGSGYRPPRKDGGADLVAIRRLAGSSQAVPTALVQTTVSSDLRTKSRDIDLGVWRTWIDLSPATLVVLAVPHVAAADEIDEAHASGILLLDRLRLAQLLKDELFILPGHLSAWAEQEWSRCKRREAGRLQ